MENVWEIRKRKKLHFILHENSTAFCVNQSIKNKTAIIAYLYYSDTLSFYLEYIYPLVNNYDVYIITGSDDLFHLLRDDMGLLKAQIIKKENRGRDVSALLVTANSIVSKYKYFCFIHDKKSKSDEMKADIYQWTKNMWDNMIVSAEYVENVLGVFEGNDNLGLLTPLAPLSPQICNWYRDSWYNEFDGTTKLAKELKLHAYIDKKYQPLALGTVFWGRTGALMKLFQKGWSYDDFDPEPMASGGTISHSIERIFPYVAQDAGYDTGTVLNSSMAGDLIEYLQELTSATYDFLCDFWGINSFSGLKQYSKQIQQMVEYCKEYKNIYIYGNGIVGNKLRYICNIKKLHINGFIVSKKSRDELKEEVVEIDDFINDKDTGIIIGVSRKLMPEIVVELEKRNIKNYFIPFQ